MNTSASYQHLDHSVSSGGGSLPGYHSEAEVDGYSSPPTVGLLNDGSAHDQPQLPLMIDHMPQSPGAVGTFMSDLSGSYQPLEEHHDDESSAGETPSLTSPRMDRSRHRLPPPSKIPLGRRLNNLWVPEVASWTLSLVCFAAIVIVLVIYRERSIRDWKFPITLNTLIAILASVGDALLAGPLSAILGQTKWEWFRQKERPVTHFQEFEDASRGFFGSLKFLLTGRRGLVAITCAILTILLLSINPFVQQIVTYRTRQSLIGYAKVPIATDYSGIYEIWSLNPAMEGAIYSGLLSNVNTTFDVVPDCPGGNCTWPAYESLAVCETCMDLTEKLVFEPLATGNELSVWGDYYLPNGFGLTQDDIFDAWANDSVPEMGQANNFNISSTFPSTAFHDRGAILLDVHAIVGGGDSLFAMECILQACVKTYNASSVNGRFVESEIGSWTNNSNVTITDNMVEDPDNGFVLMPPNSGGKFTLPNWSAYLIQCFLASMFVGNWGTYGVGEGSATGASDANIIYMYQAMSTSNSSMPTFMSNVAQSMTVNMRTSGNQSEQIYQTGVAEATETYIHVEWPWITMPLAVLFIVLILLIFVIIDTKKKQVHAWKTSSLATLSHGLDEQSRRLLADAENAEVSAAEISVSLEKVDGEWRLIATHAVLDGAERKGGHGS